MTGMADGAFDRALRPIAPTGPLARASDPDTSHKAGKTAANPARLSHAQRCVLALLAANWREHRRDPDNTAEGLTDFEYPHIQQTSAGKRRLELERAGLVEFTGTTRESPTGSAARVYRITPIGLFVLAGFTDEAAA